MSKKHIRPHATKIQCCLRLGNPMKHLHLRMVGKVARGTAKVGSRLYEMPPLTFRVGPSLRPVPPRRVGGGISVLFTMSDSEEVWKPAPGFESAYRVSNHGGVKSVTREIQTSAGYTLTVEGQIMKKNINDGYEYVGLRKPGQKNKNVKVHHLVALAFIGSPPGEVGKKRGQYQIHHIDGDKSNNHADNLKWVEVGNHQEIKFERGAQAKGTDYKDTKLTPELVKEMRERRLEGETMKSISQDYPACEATCARAIIGETWSHVDYLLDADLGGRMDSK